MATATEIRDRAAQELGVLRLNQSLPAEHATRITQGYAEVYAKLKKDGNATWPYAGEVPDEITPEIVFLVAENCLGTYSVSEAKFNRIKLGAENARREVRKFTAPDYVSQEEAEGF